MRKRLIVCILLSLVSPCASFSQEEETGKDPEKAFVRIINASTVVLPEPWKSGVDLDFKDEKLALDIRGGEAASYRQISFTGKDTVEAKATGQARVIGSVPANFEKGGFYSIYLTGVVDATGFKISPLVVKDFPTPSSKIRSGFARVGVFNAITTFPVKLQVAGGTTVNLTPLAFTEIYLESGSHPYRLFFPYKKSERDMQGFFLVNANSEFSAVVCASPEKPDRPILRFLDNSTAKRDVEEALEAAKKEKATKPETGTGASS